VSQSRRLRCPEKSKTNVDIMNRFKHIYNPAHDLAVEQ